MKFSRDIPSSLQAIFIVDSPKLTIDRFYKWLPRHLVGAMALGGLYHFPILRDLGFVEIAVAKFLSGLSIHRRQAPLDEVQGPFALLRTTFLAIETGAGWTKQVTC